MSFLSLWAICGRWIQERLHIWEEGELIRFRCWEWRHACVKNLYPATQIKLALKSHTHTHTDTYTHTHTHTHTGEPITSCPWESWGMSLTHNHWGCSLYHHTHTYTYTSANFDCLFCSIYTCTVAMAETHARSCINMHERGHTWSHKEGQTREQIDTRIIAQGALLSFESCTHIHTQVQRHEHVH